MQLTGSQVVRFILVVLLQGLILRRISLGGPHFNYISILFYPVLIMLLPLKTPKGVLLLVAFFTGLVIDLFYESLGVHMSACVLIAYVRPWTLKILEPRGGYPVNSHPTARDFSVAWFMRYAGILLFVFLLAYFSAEVFSLARIGEILLKTLSSFVVSFLTILFYITIFNPKD